jgi:serine/threonine protein kinase
VAGTPTYMAPEAFDGKRSEQTDIWAAGVILYKLLSGQLPFPSTDITSLIGAIIQRNPEPLPISIPQPHQRIVMCALEKNPNNRYLSAQQMLDELQESLIKKDPIQVINLKPKLEEVTTDPDLYQSTKKYSDITTIKPPIIDNPDPLKTVIDINNNSPINIPKTIKIDPAKTIDPPANELLKNNPPQVSSDEIADISIGKVLLIINGVMLLIWMAGCLIAAQMTQSPFYGSIFFGLLFSVVQGTILYKYIKPFWLWAMTTIITLICTDTLLLMSIPSQYYIIEYPTGNYIVTWKLYFPILLCLLQYIAWYRLLKIKWSWLWLIVNLVAGIAGIIFSNPIHKYILIDGSTNTPYETLFVYSESCVGLLYGLLFGGWQLLCLFIASRSQLKKN